MKGGKCWSKFADDFEERNNYVVGKSTMDVVLKKLAEQKKLKYCLELACGNGTYSKVLAGNTTAFVVTYISEEMVNATKNQMKSFSNIKIEKANGFDLPYSDNTFDNLWQIYYM